MSEMSRPIRFTFSQVTGHESRPTDTKSRPLAPNSPRLAPLSAFLLVKLAPDLAPTSPEGKSRPLAPVFIEDGARANRGETWGGRKADS